MSARADWGGRVMVAVLLLLTVPVAFGRALGFDVPQTHADVASSVAMLAVLLVLLSRRRTGHTPSHAHPRLLDLPLRLVRLRR